jgi:hypothetical protein
METALEIAALSWARGCGADRSLEPTSPTRCWRRRRHITLVVEADRVPTATGGRAWSRLQERYFAAITGRVPEYRHWLQAVYAREPVRA